MGEIKALPTSYGGSNFESRLEARWAVFFDSIGVGWEYEPEGFDLPSGWYLPDFYICLMATGNYLHSNRADYNACIQ